MVDRSYPLLAAVLAFTVGSVLSVQTKAQVRYTTIALGGQSAPGTPAGVNYSSLGTPTLNNAGHVAFTATLTGNGVTSANDQALYAGDFAAPQPIAREGSAAPGMPAGVNYSNVTISAPTLNDAGQVAFRATLTGSGVTNANTLALYAGDIDAPQLIARTGDPAPGTPAGVIDSFVSTPTLNDVGQVAFEVNLTGSGVTTENNHALYAGDFGAPQLVVREGNPAPGTPAGVKYSYFYPLNLNDAGQVAYVTSLIGSGVTHANDQAFYAGDIAAPQLVAREGDAAPGVPAGMHYRDITYITPTLNDAGQVAYRATLAGNGMTGVSDQALYAGEFANPRLVARAGNAAPGTPAGINYLYLNTPALNDAGQIAYQASLTGTGVTGANDRALYAGDITAPQLIARAGNPAPGTPAGVNYSVFFSPALNDAGQMAYFASLAGSVVTTNDYGLFAFDPILGNLLIAREGDLFDVGGGDFRTITNNGIGFFAGENDDKQTGISNDGTLAFKLQFTDGTSGIFTAVVPEPASISLLTLSAVVFAGRRRRRPLP